MLPILLQCGEEHRLYIVVWVRVKYYNCNSYFILVSYRLEREHEINAAGGAANPYISKTQSPIDRAPYWYGMVILIDKCINYAFKSDLKTRAWLVQCHGGRLLRIVSGRIYYTWWYSILLWSNIINTRTRDGETGFDCFIWQPHLAFTSPLYCW